MNQLQQDVANACAAYDAAIVPYGEKANALDWEKDFDAAFEQDEQLRKEFKLDELRDAVIAAERELLLWAKLKIVSEMKRDDPNLPIVVNLFKYAPRHPTAYKKLVALSLKLA